MTDLIPGRTYRISREVVFRGDHPSLGTFGLIVPKDEPDRGATTVLKDRYHWEEIEPEYVEGALYLAAGGSLLQRIGDRWAFYSDTFSSSFDINKHGLGDDWRTKRPLRRVHIEGET